MKITLWFPTCIYSAEDIITEEENTFLINELINIKNNTSKGGDGWRTDVYNTMDTFDLTKNNKFNNLSKNIISHTQNFAKELGSNSEYIIKESWFNFYNEGDYQEYHTHASSIFSAVYFFSNPTNSGKLIFKSPATPDMFPLKNLTNNTYNFQTCDYNPKPRTLVIFRSYVQHMVEKCKNSTPRITAAFNLT